MYYQVFFRTEISSKPVQVSIDDWSELFVEVERLGYPKFMEIHYFNQDGLVGIGKKIYLPLKDRYETYKKIKA